MATAEKKTQCNRCNLSATEIDASEICATLCLYGLQWVSFGSKSSSKPSVVRLGHGEAPKRKLEETYINVEQLRFADAKWSKWRWFPSKAFIHPHTSFCLKHSRVCMFWLFWLGHWQHSTWHSPLVISNSVARWRSRCLDALEQAGTVFGSGCSDHGENMSGFFFEQNVLPNLKKWYRGFLSHARYPKLSKSWDYFRIF